MNILIPDVVNDDLKIEKEVFGDDVNVRCYGARSSDEISDEDWASASAILAFDQLVFDTNLLKKLKKCKVIVRVGVGYDNVDLDLAKDLGIVVSNVPDYGTEEVADHAMSLLLTLSRGLRGYFESVERGLWERSSKVATRLRGKTLGIIGFGRIGQALSLRAKAFGLDIVFYDPNQPIGIEKTFGARRVFSLNELAEQSDIVSIHAPKSSETNKMINDNFFNIAKRGLYIVNTSRGSIVDLDSLERAMKSGKVNSAALDVLEEEPNLRRSSLVNALEDNEDWIMGRLVVTPHSAFYSPDSYIEMRKSASEEAVRVLSGQVPRSQVNK